MRAIYQSLFYKIIVGIGCIVAMSSLINDLFIKENFPIKSIVICVIWLLISFIYMLDICFIWKKYRIRILMNVVLFMQIMLPILSRCL